jgi:ankyrin repeat protein
MTRRQLSITAQCVGRVAPVCLLFVFCGCELIKPETYPVEAYTQLHEAVSRRDLPRVRELITRFPKMVNRGDENEDTPLHLAALRNYSAIIDFLISRGGNVNATNKAEMTPMHLAAKEGRTAAAKALLSGHPDLTIKDKRGWTARQWAVAAGHPDIVRLLHP